jgi:glycosyltransferase involved in cell wall biosynthesis
MKDDLCALGADPGKLTPIPMGIDLNEVRAISRREVQTGRDQSTFVLGYLGTLGAQRKLEVLVDALAILCAGGVNARLLLVGGSDRPEDHVRLEERAQELGVGDRVEITGLLPRHKALERIQEVDIALSPFFPTAILQSTSPTKLVEYMALGLPVVANRHPEQRIVLRESRGGVCVPWGARYFARASLWLASIGQQRRREFGERGRTWVIANRGYPKIADVVESKYLEILGGQVAS